MHPLIGHMLDRLLSSNPDLKKCAIHHILLIRHQAILPSAVFPNLKKHLRVQRLSSAVELKHTTAQLLKKQSELFYFTGIEHFEIAISCALRKEVIMLYNKPNNCILVHVFFY